MYAKTVLLGAVLVAVLGFSTGAIVHAAGVQSSVDYSLFSRIANWVNNVVETVITWVEEQSSKVARALVRGTDTEIEPAVLGDTTENDIIEPIEESPSQEPAEDVVEFFYNAQLIEQSTPQIEATAGVDRTLSVSYKNLSDVSWQNQDVSLNIVLESGTQSLRHNTWLTNSRPVAAIGIVPIGDTHDFNFLVSVPQESGTYTLALRPVIFSNGSFSWIGGTGNIATWTILVPEVIEEVSPPQNIEAGGSDEDIDIVEPEEEKVQSGEEEGEEQDTEKDEEMIEDVDLPKPTNPNQLIGATGVPIFQPEVTPPVSSVDSLSATTTSASFTVSWTTTDNGGEDAIASKDIQYQVDSGEWTDWLTETVLMSSLFTGVDESTYSFRSRARDQAENLEDYPNTADASTYVNFSVPTDPAVTSHSNGVTVTGSDDEDGATAGLQITLSGTGDANDSVAIVLSENSTAATTTVSSLGTWSQQFTLASTTTSTFSLRSSESDGDESSFVSFVLNQDPTLDVVINEIAWMGTATSANDEWIELYNASSTAISLTDWTLSASDGTPDITLSGTIASKSYFLLERTASTTVSDVSEDQIYSGSLSNTTELLSLFDDSSLLMDRVGSSTASEWFAGDNGTKATMERKDPTTSGTDSSNWADNDGTFVNGQDADSNGLTATPSGLNSVNTTIPRSITDLTFQYIYTTATSVKLYWTAPKTANLSTTTTATYDVRYSTTAITDGNFSSATQSSGEPTPSTTQGTAETFVVGNLATSTAYFFAVKTNNGVEDSGLSNTPTLTTEDGNYTTLAGFPSGTGGLVASSSSPYLVTASITVNNGNTLTIQAGTVLKMNGNYSITVNGSMIMGDSSDSINAAVITSKDDDRYAGIASGSDGSPAAGDWGTISASASTSLLDYNNAIISYGGLNNYMIRIAGGAGATTTTSIIEQSNSTGISIDGDSSTLVLTDSIVRDHYRGVEIDTLADATITGTTFTGTSPGQTRAIEIDSNADVTNITITGNNFFANNRNVPSPSAGILYQDTDTLLPAANIADNWWGASSGPTQDTHSILDDIDGILDDNDSTLTQVGWPVSFATSQITIKPSGL